MNRLEMFRGLMNLEGKVALVAGGAGPLPRPTKTANATSSNNNLQSPMKQHYSKRRLCGSPWHSRPPLNPSICSALWGPLSPWQSAQVGMLPKLSACPRAANQFDGGNIINKSMSGSGT